jgi:hypothetical protein
MATITQLNEFADGNSQLYERFLGARLQAAMTVMNTGGETAPRIAWAKKVFANYRDDGLKEFRWFLSHTTIQGTPGTLQGNITDAAIQTAVNSFVTAWAAEP